MCQIENKFGLRFPLLERIGALLSEESAVTMGRCTNYQTWGSPFHRKAFPFYCSKAELGFLKYLFLKVSLNTDI